MSDYKPRASGRAVPSNRISRLASFSGLAGGIAGNVLLESARQFAHGKRPSMSELLLTPVNALRVTHQLAHMRGAAMKLGQLISMDTGDLLPHELTDILARLRADAQHMPRGQLHAVLNQNWGRGWEDKFKRFDFAPIAAASIGQVHRATTNDGRDLAIKVQYPGVRVSIDSDVNNVAALLKLSGLIPKTLDVAPLLAEAKRQLHDEADYEREGRYLGRFGALLADDASYLVPEIATDLSTGNVLAMSFAAGEPIETLITSPQAMRDQVMTLLVSLLLRELFEFQIIQTDPNFANYRYDAITKRVVLLDFGAARDVSASLSAGYLHLMYAAMSGDSAATLSGACDIGLLSSQTLQSHQKLMVEMFDLVMAPLLSDGIFDFGNNATIARLHDQGVTLATDRANWHIPPSETLFIQRKLGGLYLLGSRLRARVNVRELLRPYL